METHLQYASLFSSSGPFTNIFKCLTDFCNTLTFINANPDTYLGYVGWAAGGFSPVDYNLTMTPIGSAGNFTDQPIVAQCLVGTRNGLGIASFKKRSVRTLKGIAY